MATRHYSTCLTPDSHKHRTPTTPSRKLDSAQCPHQHTPERRGSLHSKPFTAPFVSVYGRETRFEQVMRLKTRPVAAPIGGAEALLALQEKSQVELRQEPSRLQKIMALKVPKPTVVSTLVNYQPRVLPRQAKEKENNPPEERLWDCQQAYRREGEAEERAERQWRMQERQRELQIQRRKKQAERESANQRRKQSQFQTLVQKQVRKIERERELSQRKNGGFAIYIYPEC